MLNDALLELSCAYVLSHFSQNKVAELQRRRFLNIYVIAKSGTKEILGFTYSIFILNFKKLIFLKRQIFT
jgi:hypothetical protein